MAVNIEQNPKRYTPAYNPVIYVLSTNQGSQPNYQFIADVYITGVTTPSFFRIKRPISPVLASHAYIDISEILRSYVTQNILKTDAGFHTNDNAYVEYQVKFGEEYGPSSGVTVYADLTTDTARYAYNAVFDSPDFRTFNDNQYVAADSTKKFLTNAPSQIPVYRDKRAWLYMLTSGTNVINEARVRTYDSSGALINTYFINNTFASLPSTQSRFLRLTVGQNINDIDNSEITVGSQPILTNSVKTYDITMVNASSGVTTETRTFAISDDCTQYTTYTFHFLNKHGGFDTFTFIRRSDKTSSVERQEYRRIMGNISGDRTLATKLWGYDNDDRGRVQFQTEITDRIIVQSDWVNETTLAWLEELVYSPEVYLDDPTYGFVAVNIMNTSFDKKQTKNEKLFNLSLEFTYGYTRRRQSR
jgi:hypothetical protein